MAARPISFLDPEVQLCPFAAYDELREEGPVYLDPSSGWYIVTDYDAVRKAAMDTGTFSSVTGILLVKEGEEAKKVNEIYKTEGILPVNTLVVADPPVHTFHRAQVDKVFTVSRVKKMQEYIETIVDEMIGEIIDEGRAEFVGQFAMKIPTYIIADQLGIPRARFADFKRWSEAVIQEGDQTNSYEQKVRITKTICEFQNYIASAAENYRDHPADCMLSDMVHAEENGRRLQMNELVSMVLQIIVAGNDTTTTTLAHGAYRMITTPGLEQKLRDNPDQISNFFEEVLRYDTPVQGLWRRATRDTRIGETHIPEGSIILLKYGAANRDPCQFADPATFQPNRKNARQHLAFGSGAHFCVGNQLARAELRTAFAILLKRMKNFRLARGEEGIGRFSHVFNYGIKRLEIEFDKI